MGKAATYVLDKELTWDQVKGGSVSFALVSGSDVLYGTNFYSIYSRSLFVVYYANGDEIKTDDLENVIANIDGQTIAGRMQELLNSIFKYAVEIGYAKQNPAMQLKRIEKK